MFKLDLRPLIYFFILIGMIVGIFVSIVACFSYTTFQNKTDKLQTNNFQIKK